MVFILLFSNELQNKNFVDIFMYIFYMEYLLILIHTQLMKQNITLESRIIIKKNTKFIYKNSSHHAFKQA